MHGVTYMWSGGLSGVVACSFEMQRGGEYSKQAVLVREWRALRRRIAQCAAGRQSGLIVWVRLSRVPVGHFCRKLGMRLLKNLQWAAGQGPGLSRRTAARCHMRRRSAARFSSQQPGACASGTHNLRYAAGTRSHGRSAPQAHQACLSPLPDGAAGTLVGRAAPLLLLPPGFACCPSAASCRLASADMFQRHGQKQGSLPRASHTPICCGAGREGWRAGGKRAAL